MARKEFIRLVEEDIMTFDRLAGRIRMDPSHEYLLPRQQMTVLVRLSERPARLKDIARREGMSTPNLCATFRKLEHDGFVERTVDESDRRNTWYRCTPAGSDMARAAIERFRAEIDKLFADISPADEARLTAALKEISVVLKKMESKNA